MEENKEVVEQTTQPQEVGKLKVKMPKLVKDDNAPIKLDLSKKAQTTEETTVEETKAEEPKNEKQEAEEKVVEEVVEKVKEEPVAEEKVLEEVKPEETVEQKVETVEQEVKEAVQEAKETGKPLPENIQKLIDFMDKTGGDLQDYVKLNQDYSKLDDRLVLREYYKQTKTHLNNEEIDFLIDDRFSYDEEEATDREIKRKKLAFKEQVADARGHMDGLKSSYYEEIKAGSKLTSDQKEAINFYSEYNKNSEENKKIQEQQKNIFDKQTSGLFNNDFKGFEYKVGEKTYRYNIKDVENTKQTQSDINNFVKKFLNEKNEMSDVKGYHKSLFTAMNSDAIAQHFYEQGRADAIKDSVNKSKNVDMSPRQSFTSEKTGFKYNIVGENSTGFKVKLKK